MIDSTTGRRDHWQSMLWIVNAGGQVIVLDSYFLEFQWMLPLEEKV